VIHLPASVRVYLCLTPCDMRKSFDSLQALVREHLQLDAFAGHLFVFTSRRKDRVKILYWDRDGFAVWSNEPSSHYTSFVSSTAYWAPACIPAARSTNRSHRLQCFAGMFEAGSS
jgi:hypothetical protein